MKCKKINFGQYLHINLGLNAVTSQTLCLYHFMDTVCIITLFFNHYKAKVISDEHNIELQDSTGPSKLIWTQRNAFEIWGTCNWRNYTNIMFEIKYDIKGIYPVYFTVQKKRNWCCLREEEAQQYTVHNKVLRTSICQPHQL